MARKYRPKQWKEQLLDPESKLNLNNWRPNSLLNIDYKIVTKCLANRLRNVLHVIINPDQTCSVPGRSNRTDVL